MATKKSAGRATPKSVKRKQVEPTPRELIAIEKAFGRKLSAYRDDPTASDMEATVGMYWLVAHRDNPDLTIDDVLDMPVSKMSAELSNVDIVMGEVTPT